MKRKWLGIMVAVGLVVLAFPFVQSLKDNAPDLALDSPAFPKKSAVLSAMLASNR